MKRLSFLASTIALFLLFGLPSTVFSPFFKYIRNHVLRLRRRNQRIENIIFDLGGVLLNNNKKNALLNIGIAKFFVYVASLNNPLKIEQKLFNILHKIKPLDPQAPKAYSPNGESLLPQLIIDWLSGTDSCKTIRNTIITYTDKHPGIFKSKYERLFLLKAILTIFTPKAIASTIYPSKSGIEFVKKCKKKGFNVYILSNFDAESFELIQKKNPELFNLFEKENIFISGYFQTAKPSKSFYKILLDQSNIDPETCLFIDDQKENIKAAQQLGIHSILFKKKKSCFKSNLDFKSLEEQIDQIKNPPILYYKLKRSQS